MSQDTAISKFVLHDPCGLTVGLSNLGASIQSLHVPVGDDAFNIVLGYPTVEDYANDSHYLGATVGRYAGRIAHGKFRIGSRAIQLCVDGDTNGHVLHGGPGGFHTRLWSADVMQENRRICFAYVSNDGEQGFPGRLSVTVTYSLLDNMQLAIDFAAVCDQETVVNLANHAYFNLNGGGTSIENHIVTIHADEYTVQDEELIPVGEISSVVNTQLDLRLPTDIGERLLDIDASRIGRPGVDQNYVLRRTDDAMRLAATVFSPDSGIELQVLTTQPGLQFYSGDNLGPPFAPRDGLCLEAQNFPDAPNQPGFPSASLSPRDEYRQRTVYAFGLA